MSIKSHLDRAFFVSERKRLKLTQQQIADILFQSLDTIKKWEGGSRRIPPFVVYAFATLDVGVEPRGKDHILQSEMGGEGE